MSELVNSDRIEAKVGAVRHARMHVGRAVSAEQTVYILHSKECLDSGIDLRECRYSLALDRGIDLSVWGDWEDRAVILCVASDDSLVPCEALCGEERP